MDNIAPVDLNKLKHILGNAKSVIDKMESSAPVKKQTSQIRENYEDSYSSAPIYSESDEREPDYDSIGFDAQNEGPRTYSKEQVMASKLPPMIKEAMIKTPIPKMAMPTSKFTAEDLGVVQKPAPKKLVESSKSSDMITINKNDLNSLIDKRVNEILANKFIELIGEQHVKKIIGGIVKEGKLNIKKRTI
jgi:hypothetical protein